MSLTESQINEAIEQMRSHCKLLEETDYHSVSARGVLYTLGYSVKQTDEVITDLFDRGFTYCLDPMFPSNGKATPEFACYWGPDQLRSRVDWVVPVKHRPSNYRR